MRCRSVPFALARLRSCERSSRNCSSAVVKSTSLRKSRECRLRGIGLLPASGGGRVDGVALDGAGHAPRTAAAATEFLAGDGHDLDAVPAQERVRGGVALVAEDDAGGDGQEVVAAAPPLALGADP